MIFSDHGLHLPGPIYLFHSQDFLFESYLPVLLLIIPNDKKLYRNNLYEKIKSNQQTFITAFDIYNTLIYLASGENKKEYKKNSVAYGNSLFSEINFNKRYCMTKKFEPKISKEICKCIIK